MNPPSELGPEEVSLLYVAVTRAIRAVQLPPGLTAWLRAGDRVARPASPHVKSAPRPVDGSAEHEN
jgi:hypothetical protein